jgi:AbrB family looped-hinge helix DNA binding protein
VLEGPPLEKPTWHIKVTSKGQITLPKDIREAMVVREGDHLQATLSGDAIILTRREPYSDAEHMRLHIAGQLRESGLDPSAATDDHRAPNARRTIPSLDVDMPARIRKQREGRE